MLTGWDLAVQARRTGRRPATDPVTWYVDWYVDAASGRHWRPMTPAPCKNHSGANAGWLARRQTAGQIGGSVRSYQPGLASWTLRKRCDARVAEPYI
jgi:hypothetical protein